VTRDWTPPTRLSLIGFAIVLLLAWFCYRPGLSGGFQLDDVANLSGLQNVEDSATLAEFVLAGIAGPSGRPVALLTFALQADEWAQGPRAFLAVNIAIHLLNALLLAACLFQLSRAQGIDRDKSALIALLATGCWVLMPLLASATLLVVQRMTTLSATFMLLGLLGYLVARRRIEHAPRQALFWMSASLTLATVLATFTKEFGILLPMLVLVLESTVLARPMAVAGRTWLLWRAVFLGVPTLTVIAVLGSRFVYPEWLVAQRGFTGWERVLSELPILWIYLKKALVGLPSMLGVYQDSPPVRHSLFDPVVLVSALAWIGAAGVALLWRRRWPLLSLAVLWYLAGHLIESTVIPLELYFEHRNYLPVAGPVYAVVAILLTATANLRRLALALLPLYLVVSALLLYSTASVSGEPSSSSRFWAARYPASVRAVTTMATYQLAEEGPLAALSTIDRFAGRYPRHGYLRIQELNIRCQVMPAADHTEVVAQLRRDLPSVDFTYTAGKMLSQLMSTLTVVECNGVDLASVEELANVLRHNPRYSPVPRYNEFHFRLMAAIARQRGNLDQTIASIEKAMSYQPSGELNMMMVTTLGAMGNFGAAYDFIDDAMIAAPRHPLRAVAWRRELEKLREYTRELERYSGAED
jgi:hypothetical protein